MKQVGKLLIRVAVLVVVLLAGGVGLVYGKYETFSPCLAAMKKAAMEEHAPADMVTNFRLMLMLNPKKVDEALNAADMQQCLLYLVSGRKQHFEIAFDLNLPVKEPNVQEYEGTDDFEEEMQDYNSST